MKVGKGKKTPNSEFNSTGSADQSDGWIRIKAQSFRVLRNKMSLRFSICNFTFIFLLGFSQKSFQLLDQWFYANLHFQLNIHTVILSQAELK